MLLLSILWWKIARPSQYRFYILFSAIMDKGNVKGDLMLEIKNLIGGPNGSRTRVLALRAVSGHFS
jgi:hypothetical protein